MCACVCVCVCVCVCARVCVKCARGWVCVCVCVCVGGWVGVCELDTNAFVHNKVLYSR